MEDTLYIAQIVTLLSRKQKSAIKLLSKSASSLPIKRFDREHAVPLLVDKGLVEIYNDRVFLSILGKEVFQHLQFPPTPNICQEKHIQRNKKFFELYKQGMKYVNIGIQYEISGMQVKRILNNNADFHRYLKEKQNMKVLAKEQKQKRIMQNCYSHSLAILYPERIAELWDYQKNGDLKPEEVPAASRKYSIWFKCSKGHSWNKKPHEITLTWKRYGISGCQKCRGRKNDQKKQPFLTDIYSELVELYWNYEKNSKISLYPEKLTLASNYRVWFQCPNDGNEWEASICSTISQQWSKDNAGCKVCNGTSNRKKGEWTRRNSLATEYPDRVDKYWCYEENNKLELDPTKLTCGSMRPAIFQCPVDGHKWVATIAAITNGSWDRGNSGCAACKKNHLNRETTLISFDLTISSLVKRAIVASPPR